MENHSDDESSNNLERATTLYQYNENNYTYGPGHFERLNEWNEKIIQEEDLVPVERQELTEDENDWGPEYYDNTETWYNPIDETINESWGLLDLLSETEQHIEEV